jgi:hypothetical protein
VTTIFTNGFEEGNAAEARPLLKANTQFLIFSHMENSFKICTFPSLAVSFPSFNE